VLKQEGKEGTKDNPKLSAEERRRRDKNILLQMMINYTLQRQKVY
jgi:hypothetical protein